MFQVTTESRCPEATAPQQVVKEYLRDREEWRKHPPAEKVIAVRKGCGHWETVRRARTTGETSAATSEATAPEFAGKWMQERGVVSLTWESAAQMLDAYAAELRAELVRAKEENADLEKDLADWQETYDIDTKRMNSLETKLAEAESALSQAREETQVWVKAAEEARTAAFNWKNRYDKSESVRTQLQREMAEKK
jgi:chromosome segregation ATPase